MLKEKLLKAWRIFKRVFIWLFVAQLVYIVICRWIDPPITVTQLSSIFHGYGLQRDYVNMDEISPNMKLAVIASEDQVFPDHDGFDIRAIKKALKYNKKHANTNKKVRGASTISQQTAKNVFLWQGRSYLRKAMEFYFTFMIEHVWTKKRILEVYLNTSEMGKGIFGVQAAARAYFNKDAKYLSRAEAAMIAACLPNPKEYTVKPLCRYVAARTPNIMKQMNNLSGDDDIDALIYK